MRCLYCGKELALLKRWTGGGEFCSDAHRQQYQDEYTQLALTRLLQAKPPGTAGNTDPKAPPVPEPEPPKPARTRTASEKAPDKAIEKAPEKALPAPGKAAAKPAPQPEPVHEPEPEPEPVAVFEPEPEPEPEAIPEPEPEEEPAPAEMSSFLVEIPVPIYAEVSAMSKVETEFEHASAPSMPPQRDVEPLGTQLLWGGRLDSVLAIQFVDCATRPRDRKLDVRDFVRTAPVVEVDLSATAGMQLPEKFEEPMDILIFPHPPQGSPPLWDEPWREFSFEKELGVLARVPFRTTGIQDNEDSSDPIENLSDAGVTFAPPSPAREPETPRVAAAPAISHEPTPTAPAPQTNGAAKPVAPAPVRSTFLRPPISPKPEQVTAKVAAPKPEPELETVAVAAKIAPEIVVEKPKPEPVAAPAPPVTKPLPLTLHGLAAGRGKPVQVFAAVAAGVDVQIPRSASLPLRPAMTLGPALLEKPVEDKKDDKKEEKKEEKRPERTVVVKQDPRKGQPGRPDPRFANGKNRKDVRPAETDKKEADKREPEKREVEKREVEKREVEKKDFDKKPVEKPEQKPVAASAKVAEKQPEIEEPVEIAKPTAPAVERRPERSRETSLPAPLAAPYHPPDLGLPSLNMDTSGGFWSRLPVAGKAGVALAILALIGAAFFFMRGSGGTAAAGPQIVEAPAITAAEGGWITDWGAEPGVRKVHELSILRPSLNMTDYRISFEAQIESKALGWIYRAQDAKNYYVSKLEIVKPGLDPAVALVRYAVINGEELPHSQFPLTMPLHLDTLYKVRFDAVGDHFTTWIQDQKVDDWTDQRLKTGGVGLYSDRGERISLKGSMRVAPLVLKK